MGSNGSRLYSAVAQKLNSNTLDQTDENLDHKNLIELDPDQLLRECEEALRRRPARPHRDLIYPQDAPPCRHKLGPSIRIMQWNILAQGRRPILHTSSLDCLTFVNNMYTVRKKFAKFLSFNRPLAYQRGIGGHRSAYAPFRLAPNRPTPHYSTWPNTTAHGLCCVSFTTGTGCDWGEINSAVQACPLFLRDS